MECAREELLRESSGPKWVFHLLFIEKQDMSLSGLVGRNGRGTVHFRANGGATYREGSGEFYALLSNIYSI